VCVCVCVCVQAHWKGSGEARGRQLQGVHKRDDDYLSPRLYISTGCSTTFLHLLLPVLPCKYPLTVEGNTARVLKMQALTGAVDRDKGIRNASVDWCCRL
jgi:hypothetical protein